MSLRCELLLTCRAIIERLTDCTELDVETAGLKSECEIVVGLIQKTVTENATTTLDQDEYTARYNELAMRYEAAKARIDANEAEKQTRKVKREKLAEFINCLEKSKDLLTDYDEDLWNATVESVTVGSSENFTFSFKGGASFERKK